MADVKVSWGESTRLEIRYTGNLHGALDGLARLATVIKQERERHPGLVLMDTGNFSAGDPVTERFRGRPVAEVMQKLGFEAVLAGKDEVRWGLRGLAELEQAAGCPVLAANWAGSRGCTVLDKGGLKVRVVGMAWPEPPAGCESISPEDALRKALEGSEGDEVVIVLSQLGFAQDRSLAMLDDRIHVILEGVPYEGFSQVTRMGDTLIVPASPGVASLGSLGLDLSGTLVIETEVNGH
ncbi:MAG: hypothetical protein HY319_16990 [Armatimonadetes bacterium]|nr:hypothetical protein [Armatimonadota bacterium]